MRMAQRAFGHRARGRFADGAMGLKGSVGDGELVHFRGIRVGDEAALENVGGACDLRERAGDETAGAAFGSCKCEASGARGLKESLGAHTKSPCQT